MKITVIGAGYVALNHAVAFAYLGSEVCVVESDPKKLQLLNEWHCPIYEVG